MDDDDDSPTARSLTEVLSVDELTFIVEPRHDAAAVARLAGECERAGAHALSLSVDDGFTLDDLAAARGATALPIIARGTVDDPDRLGALRSAGADVLLAPTVDVPDDTIRAAHALGMEVVLTVRDEREIERAVETDADALHVDNRDAAGGVDVDRTFDLLAAVPVGWPVISESIAALEHVARLKRAGVDALLLDEGHLDTGLASALAVYADAASREG
jgi:indole-3-glycerol phosphate synthase